MRSCGADGADRARFCEPVCRHARFDGGAELARAGRAAARRRAAPMRHRRSTRRHGALRRPRRLRPDARRARPGGGPDPGLGRARPRWATRSSGSTAPARSSSAMRSSRSSAGRTPTTTTLSGQSLAALAIRAGLHDVGRRRRAPGGPYRPRHRRGRGERLRLPDGDLGLTGEAITTAARIQSLARPGEILLDEATRARRRAAVSPRTNAVRSSCAASRHP